MKPTSTSQEGEFEIQFFGRFSSHKALNVHVKLREIEEDKEMQSLKTLQDNYRNLSLSNLCNQVGSKIIEMRKRLIKKNCSSLIESVGYVKFPEKFREKFWRYTSLSEYTNPIPSTVLELWKQTQGRGLFQSFSIWRSKDDDRGDNILVACFAGEFYLIARWGKELKPFEELIEV